jgi:hypothetical protein
MKKVCFAKQVFVLLIFLVFAVLVNASPVTKYYGNPCGGYYLANIQDVRSGNIPTDPLFAGGVGVAITDINATDIRHLWTSPVTLVAAPSTINPSGGTHQVIDVLSVILTYNYTTAAFDSNSATMAVWYFNGTSTYTAATGTSTITAAIGGSADNISKLIPVAVAGVATLTENMAVKLKVTDTGDPTGSTAAGILRVIVTYRIVPTGL